jgi:hypothetical protein
MRHVAICGFKEGKLGTSAHLGRPFIRPDNHYPEEDAPSNPKACDAIKRQTSSAPKLEMPFS